MADTEAASYSHFKKMNCETCGKKIQRINPKQRFCNDCSQMGAKKRIADYNKKYFKKIGSTLEYKKHKQVYNRGRNYNLTVYQFEQLLKNQNNRCAICGISLKTVRQCIDHNHVTNKIRGILCNACNWGIGHFKENTDNLNKAVKYLKKWEEK